MRVCRLDEGKTKSCICIKRAENRAVQKVDMKPVRVYFQELSAFSGLIT